MSSERELLAETETTRPNRVDFQYLNLLQDILINGEISGDRTGTGTKKLFGAELRFRQEEGFPLLTTKRVFFRGVKEELLWMISGETKLKRLVENKIHIWTEWPYQKYLRKNGLEDKYPKYSEAWENYKKEFEQKIVEDEGFSETWGDLGPVYGFQWRHWPTRDGGEIDQLANAIHMIKNNPNSRRIIVTAWNPEDLPEMALPPCHMQYQFNVSEEKLNLQMYQRSVDTFLGLPFNMAQYSLLLSMVAQVADYEPGELIMHLGDTHLYLNHLDQAREQLSREPRSLPILKLNPLIKNIDEFTSEDIKIEGYNPHSKISASISV
jgi:thymidylate synthase